MNAVNKKKKIVLIVLTITSIAIIASQAYWIIAMYNSYEKEIILDINKYLERSVYIDRKSVV